VKHLIAALFLTILPASLVTPLVIDAATTLRHVAAL